MSSTWEAWWTPFVRLRKDGQKTTFGSRLTCMGGMIDSGLTEGIRLPDLDSDDAGLARISLIHE